jgi:hypothetical protein
MAAYQCLALDMVVEVRKASNRTEGMQSTESSP